MGRFSFLTSLVVLFTLSLAIRPDQLDIQLNTSLFKVKGKPKKINYDLVIEITGLKDWEDKHILDMAFSAHKAFSDQFDRDIQDNKYPFPEFPKLKDEDKPSVTTTMVVDNTAFISTSLKGRGSYIYDVALNAIKNDHPCEGPVLEGLRRCQQKSIDVAGKTRIHRREAKCGEYMAALSFCIATAQQRDLSGAKIVTIITNNENEHVIIPPCDKTNSREYEPNDWGCNEFTREMNMHVVTDEGGREAKDVAEGDYQAAKPRTRFP